MHAKLNLSKQDEIRSLKLKSSPSGLSGNNLKPFLHFLLNYFKVFYPGAIMYLNFVFGPELTYEHRPTDYVWLVKFVLSYVHVKLLLKLVS